MSKDKHVICKDDIWFGYNSPNIVIDIESYEKNKQRAIDYLKSQKKVYIFDGYLGWDIEYQIKIRIICSRPYHALFANNMLIRPLEKIWKILILNFLFIMRENFLVINLIIQQQVLI